MTSVYGSGAEALSMVEVLAAQLLNAQRAGGDPEAVVERNPPETKISAEFADILVEVYFELGSLPEMVLSRKLAGKDGVKVVGRDSLESWALRRGLPRVASRKRETPEWSGAEIREKLRSDGELLLAVLATFRRSE